jgi:hypothetical protein
MEVPVQPTTRIPGNTSVYELIRTRPEARERLSAAGLTNDFLDYRIGDAARAVGVPLERILELAEPEPAGAR